MDTGNLITKYRPQSFSDVIGQDAVVRSLQGICKRKDAQVFLFSGPAGCGKEQPLTSNILTPFGWKPMGELSIGDILSSSDGTTCKVVGVYPQGIKPCYRITFDDRTYAECGLGHLWKVAGGHFSRDGWLIRSTEQLINTNYREYSIPLVAPLEFKEPALSIHPYILGVLIGDGYLLGNGVSFSVPPNKENIKEKIEDLLGETYTLSGPRGKGTSIQYSIVGGIRNKNSFPSLIQELGLNVGSKNRFLPTKYKFSSKDSRLELLRGLMDTDGSCWERNGYSRTTYHTLSPQLALDVADIVRSLGGVVVIRSYDRKEKGIEYQVNIRLSECPFWLAKKASVWKAPSITYGKRIKSISYIGDVKQQCIKVSAPDELYITDGFNLTHNTTLARLVAKEMGVDKVHIQDVDAASKTGVDDMRQIQDLLQYRSFGESGKKAIIIDECHRLSGNAFDSLLKVLEEPPAHVIWCLCTTNPNKVPKTLQSRCAKFEVKLVSDKALDDLLVFVCEEERLLVEPSVRSLLIQEAYGSPRQLLSNFVVAAYAGTKKEAAELLHTAIETDTVRELCQFIVQGSGSWRTCMSIVSKIDDPPESVRIIVCNYLGACLKNAKDDKAAVAFMQKLEAFSQTYNSAEGIAPLLLSIGRALFSE